MRGASVGAVPGWKSLNPMSRCPPRRPRESVPWPQIARREQPRLSANASSQGAASGVTAEAGSALGVNECRPAPRCDVPLARSGVLPDVASKRNDMTPMRLALFDLDGTLLSGDSDLMWCEFLIDQRVLDDSFRQRSGEISQRYAAGTVIPRDFYEFFAGTMARIDPSGLPALREAFLREWIRPRIPADSRALLQRHRDAGDTLVLTTATNRVISELTATELAMDHYLCTELEQVNGRFTGRTTGTLNMRTGKIDRLRQWLAESGQPQQTLEQACFYTDSINDLALLSVVRQPIVVDPDPRLESIAIRNGWTVLRLNRQR